MNKRILISLSTIAAVAAITIGATTAYFSNTAVSTGNTFTTGTLYLEVGEDRVVSFSNTPDGLLTLSNMAPGVESQEFIIRTRNAGSLDGQLKIEPGFMSFAENDIPNAPAPDMNAEQFARLVYVSKLEYDVLGDGQGYFDLLSEALNDVDNNGDGKVSLYELNQWSYTIPEVLKANRGNEIDLKIAFTLGDKFDECTESDPWYKGGANSHCVNDYDITEGEWNVPQGDGIDVTIRGKLVQVGH